MACSGRDELCRSVLNDEWVSHPTWASEEAGFVAHKKNSFEEALHKSEEERHEYHVHIEALTRTISVLEPINARIEDMSGEERTSFKLKADFGGSSKSIYHRIIKKIYGRDSGLEIIQALQDCPGVAVPVVLVRLKQKDEEWRRAQREWSRTWREVDSKNFYKSLDHQGITFKANDKKNITAKHFVADIESTKQARIKEQSMQAKSPRTPSYARGLISHELEYTLLGDSLIDGLQMIYSFLERSSAQYTPQERKSVEKFLQTFIPTLCMYSLTDLTSLLGILPSEGPHDDIPSNEVNGHVDGSRSGRKSVGGGGGNMPSIVQQQLSGGGVPAHDLRKKLARTVQEKDKEKTGRKTSNPTPGTGSGTVSPDVDASKSTSQQTVPPTMDNSIDDFPADANDIWIQHSGIRTLHLESTSETDRPFFINTTFYTMMRLLQV